MIRKYIKSCAEKYSILDVGCGEGFVLAWFAKNGCEVTGLDYSSYGIEQQNPEMLDNFIQGNIFNSLEKLKELGYKYHIINLDNVLEHVINPAELLKKTIPLLQQEGVIVIKVPNDFNPLQLHMIENELMTETRWVAAPDHISYFNKKGLIALCDDFGFENDIVIGNFFTEFFALNKKSNYYENPEVGHECHLARVELENLFQSISPEKTINLYKALGDMNLGREIIGVFHKKNKGSE